MLTKLRDKLSYAWRLQATAVGFTAFGLGGLLISLVIFPLICFSVHDKTKRQCYVQNVINYSFRCHIFIMKVLGVMTTEIIGAHRLQTNKAPLILANHPTLIDIVLMLSLIPRTNCIVKQALFENPLLRGVVLAAGYISNSSNARELISDCISSIKQGNSLIIFPEGTRTSPGKELKFQRVSARIAIEGEIDITPVVITCQPSALTKDKKWYQIPSRRFHVRIVIGEALQLNSIVDKNIPTSLSVRKLTSYLENYFKEEVIQHECAGARAKAIDYRSIRS